MLTSWPDQRDADTFGHDCGCRFSVSARPSKGNTVGNWRAQQELLEREIKSWPQGYKLNSLMPVQNYF